MQLKQMLGDLKLRWDREINGYYVEAQKALAQGGNTNPPDPRLCYDLMECYKVFVNSAKTVATLCVPNSNNSVLLDSFIQAIFHDVYDKINFLNRMSQKNTTQPYSFFCTPQTLGQPIESSSFENRKVQEMKQFYSLIGKTQSPSLLMEKRDDNNEEYLRRLGYGT